MWRVKQHDDDDDDDGSVSPPEESLVQTLNRKIADLHMQIDALEAAVRHLDTWNNKRKVAQRSWRRDLVQGSLAWRKSDSMVANRSDLGEKRTCP